MQQAMRCKYDVLGIEQVSNGSDQFLVQARQMRLRRLQHLFLEGFNIARIQTELRQLELEKLQCLLYPRFHRDRANLQCLFAQNASNVTIPDSEVLDKNCICWK